MDNVSVCKMTTKLQNVYLKRALIKLVLKKIILIKKECILHNMYCSSLFYSDEW
jgi:hypothetical protein